ncbi:MAG TPA: translation elongation factor Ts [Caldisericia bacterium]|nr:translation elongation factor Ts [Caldisericia bacterium]HPF49578.1 translation elongation factor Ts [Caldisericia bacterium]HPI84506.1 translation elongation factor Ts [Caldisericia bacterium]HPQ93872.1 translation elongation factor Ts [Caldisericia bacterium]HRV75417.1 translation elongation factor Ts [Caldisericia bacterium]
MGLAQDVKTLRERTEAPMMDCKKALTEAGGDIEKAIQVLREKGIAKAAKKADRETSEGRIGLKISDDRKKVVLVKLSCETDFVAKNDNFIKMSQDLADLAMDKGISTKEDLLKATHPTGSTVEEEIKATVGKIGENIQLANVEVYDSIGGYFDAYAHMGNKLIVLVEVNSDKDAHEKVIGLAHEMAMQVAIDNPDYVCSTEIPKDVVDKEREVIMNSEELAGKPDNVREKIAEGKLKAFFKSCCLLDLPYMRESKKTISELVAETEKEIGGKIEVVKFCRISIGE